MSLGPVARERLLALLVAESAWNAVRAQGAGGQNVNKVSSAVHLRFDVRASSLPAAHQARLLALRDQRISEQGVIVIKAQEQRTQARNLEDARARLYALVASVAQPPRPRVATRPTLASQRRRLEGKGQRSELKRGRGKVAPE